MYKITRIFAILSLAIVAMTTAVSPAIALNAAGCTPSTYTSDALCVAPNLICRITTTAYTPSAGTDPALCPQNTSRCAYAGDAPDATETIAHGTLYKTYITGDDGCYYLNGRAENASAWETYAICDAGYTSTLNTSPGSITGQITSTRIGFTTKPSCVVCPAGGYCPGSNTEPILCDAGTYNPNVGSSTNVCVPCGLGNYCSGSGNVAPTGCPAGTYNDTTSYATSFFGFCKYCPAGFYCPTGSAAPQTCPPGQVPNSSSNASHCVEPTTPTTCPAGQYLPNGTMTCVNVGIGHFSPDLSVYRYECPNDSGTIGNVTSDSLDDCRLNGQIRKLDPDCTAGGLYYERYNWVSGNMAPPALDASGDTYIFSEFETLYSFTMDTVPAGYFVSSDYANSTNSSTVSDICRPAGNGYWAPGGDYDMYSYFRIKCPPGYDTNTDAAPDASHCYHSENLNELNEYCADGFIEFNMPGASYLGYSSWGDWFKSTNPQSSSVNEIADDGATIVTATITYPAFTPNPAALVNPVANIGAYINSSATSAADACGACTNLLDANAHYTGAGTAVNNCPADCNADYYNTTSGSSANCVIAVGTINLDQNAGSGGSETVQRTFGQPLPSITPPTRTGYSFDGYYSQLFVTLKAYSSDGAYAYGQLWDPVTETFFLSATPKPLLARWIANTYTVSFDNGGAPVATPNTTATYELAMPTITPPAWGTDYTFLGYFDASTGGIQYYNADGTSAKTYDTANNITLYAQWQSNAPTTCPSGQYLPDDAFACVNVGVGYYSKAIDTKRYKCPTGLSTATDTSYSSAFCIGTREYIPDFDTDCIDGYLEQGVVGLGTLTCDGNTCEYANFKYTYYVTDISAIKPGYVLNFKYTTGFSYEKNTDVCLPAGTGYWAIGGEFGVNMAPNFRIKCPDGYTTTGFGAGADDATDCKKTQDISISPLTHCASGTITLALPAASTATESASWIEYILLNNLGDGTEDLSDPQYYSIIPTYAGISTVVVSNNVVAKPGAIVNTNMTSVYNACAACGGNTFSGGGTVTSCTSCASGYGITGTGLSARDNMSDCQVACPENSTVNVAGGMCEACDFGYYAIASAISQGNIGATCAVISATCAAGEYLSANTTTCATCPIGQSCDGGTFTFNPTDDQGIATCTNAVSGATYTDSGTSGKCPWKMDLQPGEYYLVPDGVKQCESTYYCKGGEFFTTGNVNFIINTNTNDTYPLDNFGAQLCPDGWRNGGVGLSEISQCSQNCPQITVNNGVQNPVATIVNYPANCEYNTACNGGFYLDGGQCVGCGMPKDGKYCNNNMQYECPANDTNLTGWLLPEQTLISQKSPWSWNTSNPDGSNAINVGECAAHTYIGDPRGEFFTEQHWDGTDYINDDINTVTKFWYLAKTGYYLSGAKSGTTYYSNSNACTNAPINAHYTDAGTPDGNDCPWICNNGYFQSVNQCINQTTITFDATDGSGGDTTTIVTYNSAMPSITPPTRAGYDFAGYFDMTSDGKQYYNPDGTSAANWDKQMSTTILFARWSFALVQCLPGQYLPAGATGCIACPENHYCNGGQFGVGDSVNDYGIDNCPDEAPFSAVFSYGIEYCWATCELAQNAATMTGRDYYGLNDTCAIGTCADRFSLIGKVCVETTCLPNFEMVNGACQLCNRENALSYKPNGNCEIASCGRGYHPNGQSCESDTRNCNAPNAADATQTWNSRTNAFDACVIKTCDIGFALTGDVCVPTTQNCTVDNGHGTMEWDDIKNTWGECVVESCDAGYTNNKYETNEHSKPCGVCKNKFDVAGNVAASGYVRECEIASCMYAGEMYNLTNNECMPICDDGRTDETGTMEWNNSTKKCNRTCNPGFTSW